MWVRGWNLGRMKKKSEGDVDGYEQIFYGPKTNEMSSECKYGEVTYHKE